jgi:hypothetical protein
MLMPSAWTAGGQTCSSPATAPPWSRAPPRPPVTPCRAPLAPLQCPLGSCGRTRTNPEQLEQHPQLPTVLHRVRRCRQCAVEDGGARRLWADIVAVALLLVLKAAVPLPILHACGSPHAIDERQPHLHGRRWWSGVTGGATADRVGDSGLMPRRNKTGACTRD